MDTPDRDAETSLDPENWTEFRTSAHEMLDSAIDHVQHVRDCPIWNPVSQFLKDNTNSALPMVGQGTKKVCQELLSDVPPYSTGNTHPRFWGWVHGSGIGPPSTTRLCGKLAIRLNFTNHHTTMADID